jgi:hypothetical protein
MSVTPLKWSVEEHAHTSNLENHGIVEPDARRTLSGKNRLDIESANKHRIG